MAPIIPTCRPLVTPLRAAIIVAVLASACSVVLALDGRYGAASSSPPMTGAGWACTDRVVEASTAGLVASAALHKPLAP